MSPRRRLFSGVRLCFPGTPRTPMGLPLCSLARLRHDQAKRPRGMFSAGGASYSGGEDLPPEASEAPARHVFSRRRGLFSGGEDPPPEASEAPAREAVRK